MLRILHRFVIPLNYWEQLTMASNYLMCYSLLSTVAQFILLSECRRLFSTIKKAELHCMPTILHKKVAQLLDSLYNMILFNSKLLIGLSPLAIFEQFINDVDSTITICKKMKG